MERETGQTRQADEQLRAYLHRAVEQELTARGQAVSRINDSDRFADLGIDSLGVLRLYLRLQEFPGADLARIADEGAPERVSDLVALGSKAVTPIG